MVEEGDVLSLFDGLWCFDIEYWWMGEMEMLNRLARLVVFIELIVSK